MSMNKCSICKSLTVLQLWRISLLVKLKITKHCCPIGSLQWLKDMSFNPGFNPQCQDFRCFVVTVSKPYNWVFLRYFLSMVRQVGVTYFICCKRNRLEFRVCPKLTIKCSQFYLILLYQDFFMQLVSKFGLPK